MTHHDRPRLGLQQPVVPTFRPVRKADPPVLGAGLRQCHLLRRQIRRSDATLVSDAHTTEDQSAWGEPTPDLVIAHTNLYWTHHRAPGREAGTVTTAEATFAAS